MRSLADHIDDDVDDDDHDLDHDDHGGQHELGRRAGIADIDLKLAFTLKQHIGDDNDLCDQLGADAGQRRPGSAWIDSPRF